MTKIKTAFKPNLLVSLIIGGWLFFFIILVKPFQIEPLVNSKWIIIALGYSAIAICSYLLIVPLQNIIFTKKNSWNLKYEITLIFIFYFLTLIISYLYHKSDFTNGLYNLQEFSSNIFLPSLIVVTPLLIFARVNLVKIADETKNDIIINGTYKLDYLKIKPDNLVCVSSSKNYVYVYYLDNGRLTKKMIRTSLKKIESDISLLVRVHRSHLINPAHIISWKNSNSLLLTQIEVPITKNFKKHIKLL